MRAPRRPRVAARAALGAVLAARVARAQEAPVELARVELLREAEEAARRGEHARAVVIARRAAAIRTSPSIAHFLAREHEALGQHLDALAQAAACTRAAEADRGLHNRDALLRACSALSARASARVGHVVVRLAAPRPAGWTVRVAGAPLPAALLGVPYAVTVGAVYVEAEAPGFEAARRTVTVAAGQVETVALSLVASPPAAAPHRVVPPFAVVAHTPSAGLARRRWVGVGLSTSSLAAASLLASGVAYALATDAQDARDAACPSPCPRSAQGYAAALGHDARYRDLLALTTGTLVAGAALSLGAALWWWLARPAAPRLTPALNASREGLAFGLAARW